MIKISALVILLHISTNICNIKGDLFCDDGKVDTALTFEKNTFLFRKNKVWLFDSRTKLVSNQSVSLNDLLKDHRIKSIDAMFLSSTDKVILLYIFSENKYFILKARKLDTLTVRFTPLSANDENEVPIKWSIYGDKPISNWFPTNIDDAIVLYDDRIFLFHGSSIRYTQITKDWPEGNKSESPFDGPLKSLSKIDAVFRMPGDEQELKQEIVLVQGFNYCLFTTNIVDFNITRDINEGCKWKDSREFFTCGLITTKPIPKTDTTTKAALSSISTEKPLETKTITLEHINETSDEYIVVLICIIIFVFTIAVIVFVTIVVGRFPKRLTQHKSGFSKVDLTTYEIHDKTSSILTINSNTGETVRTIHSETSTNEQ